MRAFLLLFLIFPVLELFVFVKVSAAIGFFPALLLIIAGSALGVLVMRVAGLATALRARESLQRGELPAEDMFGHDAGAGRWPAVAAGLHQRRVGPAVPVAFHPSSRRTQDASARRSPGHAPAGLPDDPFQPRPNDAGHRPNVIEGEYERHDK